MNTLKAEEFQMKNEQRGIGKVAIVAIIVVIVIVVVAVVAVVLMKPTEEVTPMAGATLIGSIDIREKASGGTINFTISEDGASITYVCVTLNDVESLIFAGSMSHSTTCSIPITGSAFSASVPAIGEIEGQFTSPTKASGTINIIFDVYQMGNVEFGEWNWSAKVD
jgi:hypothetical protein